MERTKIRWKKIGGGSARLANGRIIKPNQIFTATEAEIPESFRQHIVPLDDIPQPKLETISGPIFEVAEIQEDAKPEQEITPSMEVEDPESIEARDETNSEVSPKSEYRVQDRGRAWFNVIHVPTGKTMNAKALRLQDAIALVESLQ